VRFGPAGRPHNSLMALLDAGPPVAVYDKWHLVPFGEYQPTWFPLPIQVVPGGGFAAGPGPATLHVPGLPPVGALICYETIFPAQVADETDRPDWLVNVTNDAWFGNSTGPRQHLAAARLRAVEEGLPLMRAANTGITVGFDANGRELGRLGMGTAGVLVLALPGHLPPTPFARLGLVVPLVLGAVVLLAGAVPVRRRRNRAMHQ
jgi:apolipoprotein N-acyltransferase